MAVDVPPGLVWLGERLPGLLTPPVVVVCARLILNQALNVYVPIWLTAIACILSLPIAMSATIVYTRFSMERQARAHGAVLPPQIYDPSFGGLNTLKTMVHNFQEGYLGECIHSMNN